MIEFNFGLFVGILFVSHLLVGYIGLQMGFAYTVVEAMKKLKKK